MYSMEYIRRILDFLKNKTQDNGMTIFRYTTDTNENRIATVHTDGGGYIMIGFFTEEEWAMVKSVAELTETSLEEEVMSLIRSNDVVTIIIDPKEL